MATPKFRSKLEECVARELKDNGIKFEYETEKIPYHIKNRSTTCRGCGSKECYQAHVYVPDFIIHTASGGKVYVETKGRFTSKDRTKMLAVCKGRDDVWMLFPTNNKLNKRSSTRYDDWCRANGIRFGLKDGKRFVPTIWVAEWKRRS
jgi:predicted nuclease of restriction endonuclease-like RecB superfamily